MRATISIYCCAFSSLSPLPFAFPRCQSTPMTSQSKHHQRKASTVKIRTLELSEVDVPQPTQSRLTRYPAAPDHLELTASQPRRTSSRVIQYGADS
ncbi:hypothetical protein HETIRDRAFT_434800, partial [Heterobasidion irregulare TC 32-1]